MGGDWIMAIAYLYNTNEFTQSESQQGQGSPKRKKRSRPVAYKLIKWLRNAYGQRIKRRAISVKNNELR
jgi:hypothetical protein